MKFERTYDALLERLEKHANAEEEYLNALLACDDLDEYHVAQADCMAYHVKSLRRILETERRHK